MPLCTLLCLIILVRYAILLFSIAQVPVAGDVGISHRDVSLCFIGVEQWHATPFLIGLVNSLVQHNSNFSNINFQIFRDGLLKRNIRPIILIEHHLSHEEAHVAKKDDLYND